MGAVTAMEKCVREERFRPVPVPHPRAPMSRKGASTGKAAFATGSLLSPPNQVTGFFARLVLRLLEAAFLLAWALWSSEQKLQRPSSPREKT